MPLFVMIGYDKPDALDLRLKTRPAHLDWIETLGSLVRAAGPMHDPETGAPAGSIIIVDFDSFETAKAEFANDPYTAAGLWDRQDVRPFTWVTK